MSKKSIFKKEEFFKISSNVSLDINQSKIVHPEFIPREVKFEDNSHLVEQVSIAINNNMPVLLVGETGTGKTSLVRHLAFNTNNAFVRVNHNGGTTIEDIIGRWLIDDTGKTVWADGILLQAMKNGYWYLADEINAASAEINFVYHSLLDDDGKIVLAEKGHEVVVPHKNFRFFGAMNPPAEYAGTKELNKALLSRFIVCKVDFAAPQVEAKILVDRIGIEQDVADRMVKFAGEVRMSHAKQQFRFVLSTRDLLMWASMFKFYGKYGVAAESTITNKISEDDIEAIKDIMGLHFSSLDNKTQPKPQPPKPKPNSIEEDKATKEVIITTARGKSIRVPRNIYDAVSGHTWDTLMNKWDGNSEVNIERNDYFGGTLGKSPSNSLSMGNYINIKPDGTIGY